MKTYQKIIVAVIVVIAVSWIALEFFIPLIFSGWLQIFP